jgi:hypothetical protein
MPSGPTIRLHVGFIPAALDAVAASRFGRPSFPSWINPELDAAT